MKSGPFSFSVSQCLCGETVFQQSARAHDRIPFVCPRLYRSKYYLLHRTESTSLRFRFSRLAATHPQRGAIEFARFDRDTRMLRSTLKALRSGRVACPRPPPMMNASKAFRSSVKPRAGVTPLPNLRGADVAPEPFWPVLRPVNEVGGRLSIEESPPPREERNVPIDL